jgi:hypothetical protein
MIGSDDHISVRDWRRKPPMRLRPASPAMTSVMEDRF